MAPRKRKAEAEPETAVARMTRTIPDRQPFQPVFRRHPNAIDFLFGARFSAALNHPSGLIAEEHKIPPEVVIEELRRLLAIKVLLVDHDDAKILATPLMQAIWSAAILDTQFYAELQAALRCVLHHCPSIATETERQWRSGLLVSTYTSLFSTKPIETDPSTQSTPTSSTSVSVPDSGQSDPKSDVPETSTTLRKHRRGVIDGSGSNDQTVLPQSTTSSAPRESTVRTGGRCKQTVRKSMGC